MADYREGALCQHQWLQAWAPAAAPPLHPGQAGYRQALLPIISHKVWLMYGERGLRQERWAPTLLA